MRIRSLALSLLIALISMVNCATGQIVVSTGTDLSTTTNTQIAFDNDLAVNSTTADLSKAILILAGTSQSLANGRGSSAATLGGLIVGLSGSSNGGTKNFTGGAWEIAGPIIFNDGIIVPQSSSSGKIVHTITTGAPGDITVNNPASFVNGVFYSKGSGTRIFPIGNSTGYFPAQLFGVTQNSLEIGMRVVESNPALTHGTELLDVFEDRYWEVIDPTQTLIGPTIALSSLNASGFIDPTIATVVVGSNNTSGAAVSLGGGASGDFILGSTAIKQTDRIFTLAKISSDLVEVKIHNVVTPFVDNANDYLQIENISIFPDNKVTLLDRWGVKVKEWTGFVNADGNANPAYDLSNVATGNYICVLEYKDGSNVKKLSQMVTIVNH